MKHLRTDEIIDFVMLDSDIDAEQMEWALAVNAHIRSCGECLEAVQAHRRLYDEFLMMRNSGEYTDFLAEIAADGSFEYDVAEQTEQADASADGLR